MKRSKNPMVFNMERVRGKFSKSGSLRSLVMGIILMGKTMVPHLNQVKRSFAPIVIDFIMVMLVVELSCAIIVSNLGTLLENAQLLKAQVLLLCLKLLRVITMRRRCKVEVVHWLLRMFKRQTLW